MHRWHILRALAGEGRGFQLWVCHGHNNLHAINQKRSCQEGFVESQGLWSGSPRDPGPYYGGPSLESLPSGLAGFWCRPLLHHMTINQIRSFREEGLILAQGLRV